MTPARYERMSTTRNALALAVIVTALGACYPDSQNVQSTFPEPVEVQGPPGGGPGQQAYYGPQGGQQGYGPQQGAYGQPGDQSGNSYPGQVDQPSQGDPSQDPYAQGQDGQGQQIPDDPNATADVDDQQIQQTLDGYGQWQDVDGYGQVWTPDASAVGADFTPYETDGSWVYTDAGWAFTAGYGWGWLPFH